jgi:hypothetical protein
MPRKIPRQQFSISELNAIWKYEPRTGLFRWKVHASKRDRKGTIAGSHSKTARYVRLSYRGKKIYAHRAAWAIYYGRWPSNEIDHKDLDKKNNRIKNLRDASTSQNMIHRPVRRNSLTRRKGVYRDKRDGRFYPYIDVNGKRIALGGFDSLDRADTIRIVAERIHHADFSFHRLPPSRRRVAILAATQAPEAAEVG